MTEFEADLSARFAAYERILEYLLTKQLCQKSSEDWPDIRSAVIGTGPELTAGIISAEDLQNLDVKIGDRINQIFDRAEAWAERALSE
jgi:hypothetical protein